MNLDSAYTALATFALIVTLLAGWVKWARPRLTEHLRRERAKDDAILGRPPVLDSITGKELAPAVPALGVRLSNIEGVIVRLAESDAERKIIITQLTRHDRQIENLDARITRVEEGQLERIVTKAESAQMWRAVADNDVIDTDGTEA